MSLVKHQGNMVKVLVAWQNVEPKWYICTVDAGRYLCKKVTQVSLTARHRRVRASGSHALNVHCMPCLGLGMGNTVGCPNNTSHGERGVQTKGGFFKKTTSKLGYPKGRPNPFANCIA